MTRRIGYAIVLAVVGVLLVGATAAGLALTTPAQEAASGQAATLQGAEEATATFENQTSNGTVVLVESATLPEGGFVTIHNESLYEGETIGSVVGVSEYLEAGTHENVSITLYNVSGANFTQESLDEGNHTLVAMPHLDTNGNQTYDFVATEGAEDGPYTADGAAVVDNATVEVTGGA